MCTTDPGPEAGFTQVADVGLAPLADNGGSTYSHSLLPNSPAIDSGDDSVCPDIDQRGANRPRDGDRDGSPACDIGAFEW
jgi:hypothetical protein